MRTQSRRRTKEDLLRAFPFVEFVDLKKSEKKRISVVNIQIETPDHFFTKTQPPKLTQEAENKQKEKIFGFMSEAMKRNPDLIVLPELSTSAEICNQVKEKISAPNSIMVLGSYYDDFSQNLSLILADGNFYGQVKNNPSLIEEGYMKRTNDITVFVNTPIGDFAVLICYDATDFSMLAALEGYTDFLICIARTKDVVTFRNIFSALSYLQYQYVIFCNDAQFGGSSFYLPFHGNRATDELGQMNEDLIRRDFDLKKLDMMRALPRKDRIFKYPPASSKPRHTPYGGRHLRNKEYFESKSFNYLSYIRSFDILNSFLSNVNVSRGLSSIGGSESGSIYGLDDVLLKSCRAMYAPAISPGKMELSPIVLKYFLVDLSLSSEMLEKDTKEEVAERLSKMMGKQYLLFELDLDRLRDSLSTTPELVDEILRIRKIEEKKRLRHIPKEFQVERGS
jgi:hypothetical protein